MLESILEEGVAAAQWDLRVTTVVIFLSVFISTQAITMIQSHIALSQAGEAKTPPIVPYAIPGVGNLFPFVFDTKEFYTKMINSFGPNSAASFRLLTQKISFVTGADNVLALFKASREVTTLDQTLIAMHNAFGSPESSREANSRDNTGILAQPLPGSNDIGAHNRLFHIMHKTSNDNLTGSALAELASRFMSNLEAELSTLDISEDEWTEVPDFYAVVQKIVFNASTKALFGTHIFEIHPVITTEFWEYDEWMPELFKGIPHFFIPRAIRARDRILATLKQWHVAAYENCDLTIEENQKAEWEPYFGSKLVGDRLRGFSKIDGNEATALAAADLGLLWAANANIVPIVGWTLLDTLARPALLATVRSEIQSCYSPSSSASNLDMPALLANPLLQSIYSEELRLRGATSLSRAPTHDLKIGNYVFPKDKVILVSGWHEQRDRSVWNEGSVNGTFHSVEEFWAERFIVYPDNPLSGPRKPSSSPISSPAKKEKEGGDEKPYYTTKPVEGSYVPYGGGLKICKGRFYAKQEALGSLALFLMMFDVEFVNAGPEGVPKPNMRYFPFGVVPPLAPVLARMRRRKWNA